VEDDFDSVRMREDEQLERTERLSQKAESLSGLSVLLPFEVEEEPGVGGYRKLVYSIAQGITVKGRRICTLCVCKTGIFHNIYSGNNVIMQSARPITRSSRQYYEM
jgi:hypothetical protein